MITTGMCALHQGHATMHPRPPFMSRWHDTADDDGHRRQALLREIVRRQEACTSAEPHSGSGHERGVVTVAQVIEEMLLVDSDTSGCHTPSPTRSRRKGSRLLTPRLVDETTGDFPRRPIPRPPEPVAEPTTVRSMASVAMASVASISSSQVPSTRAASGVTATPTPGIWDSISLKSLHGETDSEWGKLVSNRGRLTPRHNVPVQDAGDKAGDSEQSQGGLHYWLNRTPPRTSQLKSSTVISNYSQPHLFSTQRRRVSNDIFQVGLAGLGVTVPVGGDRREPNGTDAEGGKPHMSRSDQHAALSARRFVPWETTRYSDLTAAQHAQMCRRANNELDDLATQRQRRTESLDYITASKEVKLERDEEELLIRVEVFQKVQSSQSTVKRRSTRDWATVVVSASAPWAALTAKLSTKLRPNILANATFEMDGSVIVPDPGCSVKEALGPSAGPAPELHLVLPPNLSQEQPGHRVFGLQGGKR